MLTFRPLFLISALFFAFISLTPSLADAATTNSAVLDVNGRNVLTGTDYYILPVRRGMGGGLTLTLRNNTCPFNVAQKRREVDNGLPLRFLPVNPKDKFLPLGTDANVVFSAATICVQSTAWTLGDIDEETGRTYVTSGGVIGNPGRTTIASWFKVQKNSENGYRLFYCPTVCDICRPRCGDVGVFYENGTRWLGLTTDPFPVMFKKV